ncbi:hypothetical protein [Arthrobacter wenxiniae]|uniref:Lipoprotein n=1 Tax=Arthrobacter wenxiniae TaxID=2713570 RepID=A0A7Y7IET4_9MICC|nr:hypothetical protein [Arthrobacter wenxiniae]NVM93988.1 hypothetical protein [Arthrobacter wenxiniae]
MQRRTKTARTTARRMLRAAAAAAAALSLAACGVTISPATPSPQAGGTTQTGPAPSSSGGSGIPVTTGTAGTAGPGSGTAGPASGSPSASPAAEPTAAQWKTYTDPGRTVSFDLPADWITQQVPGQSGKGLRVEVRDSQGDVVATLQTHMSRLGGACQPKSARPYTVLASIPLQIPSNNTAAAAVAPRYVYRVIRGATHFYASYGITDQTAGADGKACLVYNTVRSDTLGIYMFGDVLQFTSALDGSAGLRAFATIADAQAYMRTSGYLNVQRMVTSLTSLG